jgi:hypothetical protein
MFFQTFFQIIKHNQTTHYQLFKKLHSFKKHLKAEELQLTETTNSSTKKIEKKF